MKLLKKLVIAFVLIYVVTLGLVYVDVYDSRPIVNLFKNFQSDSSLKIVDFSGSSISYAIVNLPYIIIFQNFKVSATYTLPAHLAQSLFQ